jgi:hypothetical protein
LNFTDEPRGDSTITLTEPSLRKVLIMLYHHGEEAAPNCAGFSANVRCPSFKNRVDETGAEFDRMTVTKA